MFRIGHDLGRAGESRPVFGEPDLATVTLRELAVDQTSWRPRLLDQHVLILFTVGHGTQDVDFQVHQCRPGTLILARPGQVIRHGGQPGLDAVVVSWRPDLLTSLGPAEPPVDPAWPGYWQLAGEDEDAVINEVSQLVVDCQRHRSGGAGAELLRHQLAVLLLRLELLSPGGGSGARGRGSAAADGPGGGTATAGGPGGATTATYLRLRHEVEHSYGQTRRVEDYADRMNCSVRTLTRACLAATGRSAKQLIDDRVALQAMRLLAATDAPIADIGRRLGFPEPTNFGRFFQREVGRSPGAFRAAMDSAGTHRPPGQRTAVGGPVLPAGRFGSRTSPAGQRDRRA